jgi:N-acetylglucosaminyl-diphospho-decaprenol L-rhamnosyltransferase
VTLAASLVLVSYRDDAAVSAFLQAAAKWECELIDQLEFVVVRNDWQGTQLDIPDAASLRLVELPQAHNLGYAAGFNVGLQAAQGEVIIAMNVDTEPTPGLVRSLVDDASGPATSAPRVVAPILSNDDGVVIGRRFYSPWSLLAARTRLRDRTVVALDVAKVEWVLGACLAARRRDLLDLGGFDERFFLYFEDVDLCWRVWEAGGEVAVRADLELPHAHGRASRKLWSKPFLWHLRSAIHFFLKHPRAAVGLGPRRSAH